MTRQEFKAKVAGLKLRRPYEVTISIHGNYTRVEDIYGTKVFDVSDHRPNFIYMYPCFGLNGKELTALAGLVAEYAETPLEERGL